MINCYPWLKEMLPQKSMISGALYQMKEKFKTKAEE